MIGEQSETATTLPVRVAATINSPPRNRPSVASPHLLAGISRVQMNRPSSSDKMHRRVAL
jgi:hypothetical protein